MQPDIFDFLKKVEAESLTVNQVEKRLKQEIETFENIRETLLVNQQSGKPNPELDKIEVYLEHLFLANQKFKHPHLALILAAGTVIEADLNREIIGLLKKLNR